MIDMRIFINIYQPQNKSLSIYINNIVWTKGVIDSSL